MARTMCKDNVDIYRVVISKRLEGEEWKDLEYYGPFDSKSAARDHGLRSRFARDARDKGLRKWRRQKLDIVPLPDGLGLDWVDE